MRAILLLIPILLMSSCTSFQPGCLVKNKVVEGLTPVVSTGLSCTKPEVVAAKLTSWIEAVGVCKPTDTQQTGTVADIVCPAVVSSVVKKVVSFGVETAFPGAGCTGAVQQAALTAALTDACKQLPVEYKP